MKVNVGWGVMVKDTGTVKTIPPPLAEMEMFAAPTVAVVDAFKIIETLPAPEESEAGERLAVTPVGRPATAMVTAETKLATFFTVSISDPLAPHAIDRLGVFTDAESASQFK